MSKIKSDRAINLLFQLVLLVWSINWSGAAAAATECGQCQPENSVACHSQNVYSLCIGGEPTHDYTMCPPGALCTDGPFICYPQAKAVASCMLKTITTTPEPIETATPTTPESTTPDPMASESSTPDPMPSESTTPDPMASESSTPDPMASEPTTSDPTASESTTPVTITTTEITGTTILDIIAEKTPNEFCDEYRDGNVPHPADKLCRQYFYCYPNGTNWSAVIEDCPEGEFFDRTRRQCVLDKPADCP